MAFRSRRKEETLEEKVLDVDASMQGSLTFRDPVNLRINGRFEGSLDTKGNLTVGEKAQVQADIVGENIVIAGRVSGNVTASRSLGLTATAYVTADIHTPILNIASGAVFCGKSEMPEKEARVSNSTIQEALMTVEELARYLEIDTDSVLDWAKQGRIPAQKEGTNWRFERAKVDAWIASEKISKQ